MRMRFWCNSVRKEEQDIRALMEILDEIKTKTSGIEFIDALSATYEDYAASQKLVESKVVIAEHTAFQKVIYFFKTLQKQLDEGPPSNSVFISNFVEQLYQRKDITKAQLCILNRLEVIKESAEGKTLISLPRRRDFWISSILMSLMALVLLLATYAVFAWMPRDIAFVPVTYGVGTIIGYFMRDAYDSSWGRLKLAKLIKQKHPWIIESY